MRLITILVRELRVLCRKRSTYALRMGLTGLVLATWALLLGNDDDSIRQLSVSAMVAQILFAFGAALAISDTIASERRNRTLGLLLLTPLRPSEVLLGKLFTTGSQFLLCLLAVLPILALPVLGGSITWQDVLSPFAGILAGTLLGMAIGLFASARSTRADRAIGFSSVLFALLFVLMPACAGFLNLNGAGTGYYWYGPVILTLPPADLPAGSGSWSSNLAVVLGICLVFFLLARKLFLLAWAGERDGSVTERAGKPPLAPAGGRRIRRDGNPCDTLVRRLHPSSRSLPRWLALFVILSLFWLLLAIDDEPFSRGYLTIAYCLILLPLIFIYWNLILKSVGSLHDAGRSGMLELVLATPLSPRSILDRFTGSATTWLRWSVALILVWNLFAIISLTINAFFPNDGFTPLVYKGSESVIIQSGDGDYIVLYSGPSDYHELFLPFHLGLLLTMPLEFRALHWTGLWMGLIRRNIAGSIILLLLGYVAAPIALCFVIKILFNASGVTSPFPMVIAWHAIRACSATILLVLHRRKVLRSLHRRILPVG